MWPLNDFFQHRSLYVCLVVASKDQKERGIVDHMTRSYSVNLLSASNGFSNNRVLPIDKVDWKVDTEKGDIILRRKKTFSLHIANKM